MASGSVPGPPCELANIREMLSVEMWIQILGYLDQKELCTLSEVDSQFYRLARDHAVWCKECGSNLTTAEEVRMQIRNKMSRIPKTAPAGHNSEQLW